VQHPAGSNQLRVRAFGGLLGVMATLLTIGACARPSAIVSQPGDAVEVNATIIRVTDGDTIIVNLASKEEKVRLIGMDTPETKKPNTPIECFGAEASDHLHELLPEGARVRLEGDAEARDRYNRLLAYVYRADGLFVNLAQVTDGFAGQLSIAPNVAHVDEFTDAIRGARTQNKGLWQACGGNHVAAR